MGILDTIKDDLRAAFKNGNTLMQLIIINCLAFVALTVLRIILPAETDNPLLISFSFILNHVALPLNVLDFIQRPYTLLSYSFVHLHIMHLFANMFFLYSFGSILESYVGNKKTLALYIYGAIAGAMVTILIATFIPNVDVEMPLLGASASVAAIAVAAAACNPRHQVKLLIFGETPLYIVVLVFLLFNLVSVANFTNLPGSLSHLGGAAFGLLFIAQLQKGNDMSAWLNKVIEAIKKYIFRMKAAQEKQSGSSFFDHKSSAIKDVKIEAILDKIKRSGYDSLSKEEKEYLFHYNK